MTEFELLGAVTRSMDILKYLPVFKGNDFIPARDVSSLLLEFSFVEPVPTGYAIYFLGAYSNTTLGYNSSWLADDPGSNNKRRHHVQRKQSAKGNKKKVDAEANIGKRVNRHCLRTVLPSTFWEKAAIYAPYWGYYAMQVLDNHDLHPMGAQQ